MSSIDNPNKESVIDRRSKISTLNIPQMSYLPRDPVTYNPEIGLIGCGSISEHHLEAYRDAGYRVTALCDIDKNKAEKMREMFFPKAKVFTNPIDIISMDNIEVMDIATHPEVRYGIMEKAVEAGKHILSQKPFVTDIVQGKRLLEKADSRGIKIAVNQNGRWAPHFSYIRHAVGKGLIGEVYGAQFAVNWNHNWIRGTHFENINYLLLYDFGIHWFDILTVFMGKNIPKKVFATTAFAPNQNVSPPLLSQVIIEYDYAQASISFQGDVRFGETDTTFIAGTNGSLKSVGSNLNSQKVTLYNGNGFDIPLLEGNWFHEGFHGTMGELLCAVEENRTPFNGADENLKSLELCFAAISSAETGIPVKPGSVTKLLY